MGDTISNVGAHAVVINRSTIRSAFNALETDSTHADPQGLEEIISAIEASGSAGAATCLKAFLEHLAAPKRETSILRALWQDMATLVPTVAQLPQALAFVSSLLRS